MLSFKAVGGAERPWGRSPMERVSESQWAFLSFFVAFVSGACPDIVGVVKIPRPPGEPAARSRSAGFGGFHC